MIIYYVNKLNKLWSIHIDNLAFQQNGKTRKSPTRDLVFRIVEIYTSTYILVVNKN